MKRQSITVTRPKAVKTGNSRRSEEFVGDLIDVCDLLADERHVTPSRVLAELARGHKDFKRGLRKLRESNTNG